MSHHLFHVYRNTPFGREMLMQSAHFCSLTGSRLRLFIPSHPQFLLFFEHDIVTVELDSSYLRDPGTARRHAEEILATFGIEPEIFEPKQFTAGVLPEIPTDLRFMCCPRVISDLSTRVGLGQLGPRVRHIIRSAPFPVLLPAPMYRPWSSVVCFFGGSANAVAALDCALQIARHCDVPLTLFTQSEGQDRSYFEKELQEAIPDVAADRDFSWSLFAEGDLRENLFSVPPDALAVVGAYGHGIAKELLFGSKMETIQTTLPNPLLVVGPRVGRP